MAKRKQKTGGYDWVKAVVEDGGSRVVFRYRATGLNVDGQHRHDEDVGGWTDDDIRKLCCDSIALSHEFKSMIEVEWD